jgi:hypothetical protein
MSMQPPGDPPVQPWNTPVPASAARGLIYIAGFVALALIAAAGLGIYVLKSSGKVPVLQASSPQGSAYDRADHFLNVDLSPSLTEANNALPPVARDCNADLRPPCKASLIVLDKAMLDVNDAIASNQRDIPPCIGRAVQQFRDDWSAMEQGVAQAISGYTSGSRALALQGLQRFTDLGKLVKPDVDRITASEASCSRSA